MRILLVFPEFSSTFWSLKHALRFIDNEAASLPLYIFTVVALLSAGWIKRLVDLDIIRLTSGDLGWSGYGLILAITVAILVFPLRQVVELHVG